MDFGVCEIMAWTLRHTLSRFRICEQCIWTELRAVSRNKAVIEKTLRTVEDTLLVLIVVQVLLRTN